MVSRKNRMNARLSMVPLVLSEKPSLKHVGTHMRAFEQSVGTAKHEQGAEGVGRHVERPDRRIVQSVAGEDFVDIREDPNGD